MAEIAVRNRCHHQDQASLNKRPNCYRVLILNDDYTPMEFVIHVLERFFNKSREDATRVMLHVHHHGVGECGVYTYARAGKPRSRR